MKKVCRKPEIHCCVVDDHCDVVPFLQHFQRLYFGRGLGKLKALVVHVDAHPDLSVPSSNLSESVHDWNDPDNLYDILLEEEGGIAEFMIPLIYQDIFSQVVWVRSPWASQLPNGTCTFSVSRKPVRVNYKTPYYLDEAVFGEISPRDKAFDITLTTCVATDKVQWVTDAPAKTMASTAHFTEQPLVYAHSTNGTWVLDICLDYFTTHNPFMVEVVDMVIAGGWQETDVQVLKQALLWLLTNMSYRCDLTLVDYEIQRKLCLSKWVEAFSLPPGEGTTLLWTAIDKNPSDPGVPEFVHTFFGTLWAQVPRNACLKIGEYKHLLLLPHHPVSDEARIAAMLVELKTFVCGILASTRVPPICITIARSVSDGYTDSSIADSLQLKVTTMVRNAISDTLQVDVDIVCHDLSDECIEAAHDLFASSEERQSITGSITFVSNMISKLS